MNPLKHFGVNTEFIRGDTSSYNYRYIPSTCPGHIWGPIEERDHPNPGWQQTKVCQRCGYELAKAKW